MRACTPIGTLFRSMRKSWLSSERLYGRGDDLHRLRWPSIDDDREGYALPPKSASFRLHLHRRAEMPDGARSDHEEAALDFVLTAHHLTDWSNRVYDRRAGRIGHEALQWLEDA